MFLLSTVIKISRLLFADLFKNAMKSTKTVVYNFSFLLSMAATSEGTFVGSLFVVKR